MGSIMLNNSGSGTSPLWWTHPTHKGLEEPEPCKWQKSKPKPAPNSSPRAKSCALVLPLNPARHRGDGGSHAPPPGRGMAVRYPPPPCRCATVSGVCELRCRCRPPGMADPDQGQLLFPDPAPPPRSCPRNDALWALLLVTASDVWWAA